MIEQFKSRRMVGLVIVLMIVCILVMILEGLVTGDGRHHIQVDRNSSSLSHAEHHLNQSKPCWSSSQVDVLEFCQTCEDNLDASLKEICNRTGFIEKVSCRNAKVVVFRSCVRPDSSSFWKFELAMIALAFLSGYGSHRRETSMQNKYFDRINKQVSCGV